MTTCTCITCSEQWPSSMPLHAREAVLALIQRASPGPVVQKLAATLRNDVDGGKMMANLQSFTDLLLPALHRLRSIAGATVVDAKIDCDREFVTDEGYVRLVVTHEILRWSLHRKLTEPPNIYLLDQRMKKAMLVREPEAKSIAINRRRMIWRGAEARKAKPMKTEKDRK